VKGKQLLDLVIGGWNFWDVRRFSHTSGWWVWLVGDQFVAIGDGVRINEQVKKH